MKLYTMVLLGALCLAVEKTAAAPNDAALGNGLFARITTTRGDIVVRLEYQKAPLTVCNFVALAEGKMAKAGAKPFYNGLTFHRVISRANGDKDDFMIQGGDPLGTGRGGPGYQFADEFDPSLTFDVPGVLAMANAGANTNGSQFFITITKTPWLNNKHTIFGRVMQGQTVVNSIRQGERITSVTIIRNGPDAVAFKADQDAFDALQRTAKQRAESKIKGKRDADIALIQKKYPAARLTPSGGYYVIQKEGAGAKPVKGSAVSVVYKLSLLSGEVIDASDVHGGPIEFQAGLGRMIQGFDEAVLDMKVRERRLVVLPPELAYGDKDVGGGAIPANSFLVFELELVKIN
ncbi:MAG: peptidylprolyl isomerase [Treponema sp.]|jgi:peptidylprolyl isomerase|nr:peptidylprolyl isomerase [Treponema sp.]